MATARVSDQAFVTLATTDAYAFGAMVLGRSLRRVGTTRQLVVMVTPGLSQGIRQQLSEIYDNVTQVDVLDSRDTMNLDLLTRPDLGVTFTKLNCWRLTQYTKGVFLDADTVVLQNVDDLFNREELSAAPDAGWPDCFNSGVFVFTPSVQTYQTLLQFALEHGSFDGGDQGLLNAYFCDWSTKDIKKHLPFVYNCVSQAFYSYLPAFKQFGADIKIVHFIGALKPWHHAYNTGTRTVETQGDVGHHRAYLQLWWDIFMADIKEKVNDDMSNTLNTTTPTVVPPDPPPDTSYVTSPYSPPDGATTAHIADLCESDRKDDSREYGHYESFYSEPPMAAKPEYVEPLHHFYTVKGFETKWTGYSEHNVTEDITHTDTSADSNPPTETDITITDATITTAIDTPSLSDATTTAIDTPSLSDAITSDCDMEHVGLTGHMATLRLEQPRAPGSYTDAELADSHRQYSWEMGSIDYLGIDAFSNIQKRLDEVLSTPPEPKAVDPVQPPVQPTPPPAQSPAKTTAVVQPKKPQGILKKH